MYIQFHICYCLTASLRSNKQQIAPCPGTVVVAVVVIVEVLIVGLDTSVVVVGVVVHVPTAVGRLTVVLVVVVGVVVALLVVVVVDDVGAIVVVAYSKCSVETSHAIWQSFENVG